MGDGCCSGSGVRSPCGGCGELLLPAEVSSSGPSPTGLPREPSAEAASFLLKLVFPSCVPPSGGERQPRREAPHQYCCSSAVVRLLLLGPCDPRCGHSAAAGSGTGGGAEGLRCKTGGAGCRGRLLTSSKLGTPRFPLPASPKSLETHQRLSKPCNAGARGGTGPREAERSPARGVGAVRGEGGSWGGRAGTASRSAGKEPFSKELPEKTKHYLVALHIYFCRRGGWESRREMPADVVYF